MPTRSDARPARRAARRGACAAALLALLAALAGCGGADAAGAGGGGQRFVAGDGSLTVVPRGQREPAPAVSGPTFDGGTFALREHRGEVVVLNVWASWCAPCRAESPGLQRLWEELRPRGVRLVGVDVKDSPAAARAFVRRFGLTYPMVADQPGRIPLAFGDTLPPAAIPSTLVVDRAGRVAARGLGALTEAELRRLVVRVAEEPRPGRSGGPR